MPSLRAFLKQVERQQITIALETSPCPRVAAANLGLSYAALRKAANKHGLYLNRLRRQRGFIFGGMYAYLAMALAAAALAAVCYLTGRSDGRALERSEWTEQQNSDLRTANQALDAAHTRNRQVEQEKAEALSKVSAGYQKGLKDGESKKSAALDDLQSGALRLRVNLAGCEAIGSATAKAAAGSVRRDGGAATGFLGQADSAFLVAEANRADDIARQLTACQAVVRADRTGGS
jgi:prophage endopeptidase